MVNKVILVGNVGLDPEIRSLEGGVKMARLRLATTERIFNKQTQEAREHTEWHTVILWRNLADVADRFIRKGSQIYIEGRLRSREWEDQTGAKRSAVEIIADELKLLGRKPEGAAQGEGNGQDAAQSTAGQPYANQSPSSTQTYPTAQNSATPASAAQSESPINDPDDLPF